MREETTDRPTSSNVETGEFKKKTYSELYCKQPQHITTLGQCSRKSPTPPSSCPFEGKEPILKEVQVHKEGLGTEQNFVQGLQELSKLAEVTVEYDNSSGRKA